MTVVIGEKKSGAQTCRETVCENTHSKYAHTHSTHTSGFCPTFLLPFVKAEWKLFFKSYQTFYTCFFIHEEILQQQRKHTE